MNLFKVLFYTALSLFFLFNVYLCAFSALHGEVIFSNDVSRDFLLLQELDQKKVVLIGPRSSTQGLFYSSFLTYVNYPAYLIGHGDPVVVAWFWVLLGVILFVSSFFMVKKLFGVFPATLYVLIISSKLVPKASEIFEPMAMYFVMPVFLFTIIQYVKTKKLSYLLWHMVALAVFIHLSIGIGLQFLFLSAAVVLYVIFKKKNWRHLFSFLLLPLLLVNLIIFDLRHNFGMTKALIGTGGATKFFVSIPDWIWGRINHAVSLEILNGERFLWLPIFAILMLFTYLTIKKDKKNRSTYILFVFYYFGYLVLSYFNKGVLLTHYVYLVIPLTSMWLVSFLKGKYKVFFVPVVILIFLLNFKYAVEFTQSLKDSYIGRDQNSWVGLSSVAKNVANSYKGKEFGYYVFAPDAYAYQPRYAMIYVFKKEKAKAFEYKKLDTTLVIAQAPPNNDIYMDYKWWVKVPLKITKEAASIKDFPNGYKVLEYKLTPDEQKIPHDKNIELGIHFR